MINTGFESALPEKDWSPALPSLSESEIAALDQPLELLEDPPPHSKRGQQVRRLEQHGLHKAAKAVKVCGRLGEKWTYACGRFIGKIIRAHLRFCCVQCDRAINTRLFDEHRDYRERLHPAATLHRVTVRSRHWPVSIARIRDLEDSVVEAIRQWLKGYCGWGFKSLTHYDKGELAVEGIIALPPGVSLPSGGLSVASAMCHVGRGNSASAFEAMLADILRPRLTEGHGVLRADLMAAFQGGNHLRSLGIFYGLVSKKRRERKPENLHLSSTQSGAGSEVSQSLVTHPRHPCPFCGPSCRRVAVSTEILSDLEDVPPVRRTSEDATWDYIRELSRRRYVF
jgi:hypothetical protein